MSENAAQNKGERFADDLRRIRERRGVSIDEVHEETKIPRGLIESFEETGLLDHPMFNRVYLRSFVRTYARVVDISPAFTLRALEEVLEGTYRGRLAEEYLGETETVEEAPSAEETETGKEPAEAAPAPVEDRREEPSKADVSEEGEEDEKEALEAETATQEQERQPVASTEGVEAGAAASGAAAAATAGQARTEQQRGGHAAQRSRRRRDSGSSAKRQGIYLGAALLVVALGGWLLFSLLSGDSASDVEDGQAQAVAADTVAQEDTASGEETPAGPTERVDIGEAMDFRVIAAQGPIRELRVRVDDDVRRPYWIEEGEDRTFSAENQITFSPPVEATNEQPMEMMELELEGYPYPTTERDAQGRIVVTRDQAQSYLDSLAAEQ